MLYKPGKLGYVILLAVLLVGWTRWHHPSQEVLHRGWEATSSKFSQGASFADDLFDYSRFLNHPSSTSITIASPTSSPASIQQAQSIEAAKNTSVVIQQHVETPYGYVFYATQAQYACSVMVNIHRLQELFHTRQRIYVLVSPDMPIEYIEAFERRNVTVSIQTPPPLTEGGTAYYKDCLLKLLAFKMHHIDSSLKQVISMDSDQLVMQNLDYLFEMSIEVDLAAPRTYWIARDAISSAFMLINLSERLWNTVNQAIETIGFDVCDMDLVQDVLGDTVKMLPGHFVAPNSHWEDWNLPKWFHSKQNNSVVPQEIAFPNITAQDKVKLSEEEQATIDSASDDLIRQTLAIVERSSDSLSSTAKDLVKVSAQEEQINGSSGDIFDYMDNPEPQKEGEHAEEQPQKEGMKADDPAQNEADGSAEEKRVQEQNKDEVVWHTVSAPPVELKFQPTTPEETRERPLFKELYELYTAVSVLHFSGLGKPWAYSLDAVVMARPGSHPLFVQQFKTWRETALEVCPPGLFDEV